MMLQVVRSVWMGKIYVSRMNISGLNILAGFFQDPMLGTFPEMTITENLSLAFNKSENMSLQWGLTKRKKESIREKVKEIELGLDERLSTRVKLLSGGQRQALTLLMATLTEPKLLLLDEHTAALDPNTAIKIKKLTEKLIAERNITTLMVTHNMKDAINMGDRLIMMSQGEIILDIEGSEKKALTVDKLLKLFQQKQGNKFANDRTLLSG